MGEHYDYWGVERQQCAYTVPSGRRCANPAVAETLCQPHHAEAEAAGQAYYWTEEWQAGEREAAANIAAGQTVTFTDTAARLAWLASTPD